MDEQDWQTVGNCSSWADVYMAVYYAVFPHIFENVNKKF